MFAFVDIDSPDYWTEGCIPGTKISTSGIHGIDWMGLLLCSFGIWLEYNWLQSVKKTFIVIVKWLIERRPYQLRSLLRFEGNKIDKVSINSYLIIDFKVPQSIKFDTIVLCNFKKKVFCYGRIKLNIQQLRSEENCLFNCYVIRNNFPM